MNTLILGYLATCSRWFHQMDEDESLHVTYTNYVVDFW